MYNCVPKAASDISISHGLIPFIVLHPTFIRRASKYLWFCFSLEDTRFWSGTYLILHTKTQKNDMTSLNLIARAGQVTLVIGISSSGDDSRTLTVPFGSLGTNGLPEAINLSIQSANGISIPQTDVVCQAFKDAQGTTTLGPTFTDSSSASLGSNPVRVGSIFCSDAKGVEARLSGTGSINSSLSASSSTSLVGNSPSAIITPTHSSTAQQPHTTKSVAVVQPAGDSKPKTLPQPAATTVTTATKASSADTGGNQITTQSAAASADTMIPTDTSSPTAQLAGTKSTASAAAQQTTRAASEGYSHNVWTVRKVLSVGLVTACFVRWL